jgi:hypothetical protein
MANTPKLTKGDLKQFIVMMEELGISDETEVKVITKKGQGAVKDITGVSTLNISGFPALLIN